MTLMFLSCRLLDDVETGGGDTKGHGMVLAMHMVKLLKSSRKFSEILTKKYDSICHGLNCLQTFHEQLTLSVCGCVYAIECVLASFAANLCFMWTHLLTGFTGVQATSSSFHATWRRRDRARSTVPACEESNGGCPRGQGGGGESCTHC